MAKPGSRQDTVCSSPGQTPEQTPLPNTGKCDSGVVRTQRAAQTFPTQTHRRPLRPGCFGEEAPTSQRRRRGHSFTANAQSERTAKKKSPDVPSVHVIRCVLPFCRSARDAVCCCNRWSPHSRAIQLAIWFSSERCVVGFARQLDVNCEGSILKISPVDSPQSNQQVQLQWGEGHDRSSSAVCGTALVEI